MDESAAAKPHPSKRKEQNTTMTVINHQFQRVSVETNQDSTEVILAVHGFFKINSMIRLSADEAQKLGEELLAGCDKQASLMRPVSLKAA